MNDSQNLGATIAGATPDFALAFGSSVFMAKRDPYGRGGRREGAGRPVKTDKVKTKPMIIRMTPEDAENIGTVKRHYGLDSTKSVRLVLRQQANAINASQKLLGPDCFPDSV